MTAAFWGREASLLLRMASGVRDVVARLGSAGRRVAGGRPPGYREWDPDVLEVDLAAERAVLEGLKALEEPMLVLSEEAGRVRVGGREEALQGEGHPDATTAVVDPFDGSLLYRRDLPFLWAFGVGLWRGQRHRASCVADLLGGTVWVADGAAVAEVSADGSVRRVEPGHPAGAARLEEAYVATYLMKPHYFSLAVRDFGAALEASRFVVPIGGPLAWALLATGRIDAYLAHHQPLTEVYSAIGLALGAGCIVTDPEGRPPRLVEDVGARYTLVAARHPALHEQILKEVVRAQERDGLRT